MCCAMGQEQNSMLRVPRYSRTSGPQAALPKLKMEGTAPAGVGQYVGKVAGFTESWLDLESEDDLHLANMLRIPLSFLETISLQKRQKFWVRVSRHQYHMQHEVVKRRRMLPMPKRQIAQTVSSASTTAWYGTPPSVDSDPVSNTRGAGRKDSVPTKGGE